MPNVDDENITTIISETISELFDMLGKGEAGTPFSTFLKPMTRSMKPKIQIRFLTFMRDHWKTGEHALTLVAMTRLQSKEFSQ